MSDERARLEHLITTLVEAFPRRSPTSDDERRATEWLQRHFEEQGFATKLEAFEFNASLYANVALHFGLGSAATWISPAAPAAALALHLLVGTSYVADATFQRYRLRKMLPFRRSQNLLVTLPAARRPALRIVVCAHIDAACTGLLFDPRMVRGLSGERLPRRLGFLRRSLALASAAQLGLAGCDAARLLLGPLALPLRPLEWLLNLPGLLAFATTLEVALRHEVVPGANDDLSGVAALPLLAARLGRDKPEDLELVFVVTGCEEAKMGGAQALFRAHQNDWDPARTVVIALDGLSGGELSYLEYEGEVLRFPQPRWLIEKVKQVAASEARFSSVRGFEAPVGGTDASAALALGYDAVGLCCIDHELGSPLHYHLPSDIPENLDHDQILHCIDFTEALIRAIARASLVSR